MFKDFYDEVKKKFWFGIFCCFMGFVIGKTATYSSISTDCKVLGMFRIGMEAFGCRYSPEIK